MLYFHAQEGKMPPVRGRASGGGSTPLGRGRSATRSQRSASISDKSQAVRRRPASSDRVRGGRVADSDAQKRNVGKRDNYAPQTTADTMDGAPPASVCWALRLGCVVGSQVPSAPSFSKGCYPRLKIPWRSCCREDSIIISLKMGFRFEPIVKRIPL